MVLVVDFGSQYTELLVKKIRKIKIFSQVIDCEEKDLISKIEKYDAVILSGSPDSAKDGKHEKIVKEILNLNKPILGICYGMQVIHKVMGGELSYGEHAEFGSTKIKIENDNPIIDGIPPIFNDWMSHNDSVIELSPEFISIAKSNSSYSISAHRSRRIYTVQFHPETEHSVYGERILENFLVLICNINKKWNSKNIISSKISQIQDRVQNKTVYLALSGGVDSSVVASLIKKAEVKFKFIFVDTGLINKKQLKMALTYFKSEFEDNFKIIDSQEIFLERIKGVVDPEEKRKIIGETFVEVFKKEVDKDKKEKLLAQGTIHSDLIESGKKNKSQTIKTHHNTISTLRESFELIEPISDLFKDEVRELGKQLDIPYFILQAKPFPGPGYAIRIIGEVNEKKLEIVKQVDRILLRKLIERKVYNNISQCFSVLLDTKSVGVTGDKRNYGYVLAIRSVQSSDMMTAKVSNIPMEVLTEISSEIINSVPEISRVVYDLTSKPPATIEWE